jgi:GntR family transcriptional regulator
VRIETCLEDVSARLPTAEQRKLLELPRNVAVLVVARKTHTDLGQPVEFTRAAYRGDLYSAVVHSIRKRPIGGV